MGAFLDRGGVVQAVDQCRQAERVGEQDAFLPRRRTDLADRGHEFDALDPFRRRQVDVAGEGMQVFHGGSHHLAHPRIRCRCHLFEHGIRNRFRRQLPHLHLPLANGYVRFRQPIVSGIHLTGKLQNRVYFYYEEGDASEH